MQWLSGGGCSCGITRPLSHQSESADTLRTYGYYVQYGVVILPEHRWLEARSLWQRAETLGFDHAWTYDHLAWRTFRDRPWFASMPTLVAAAAATTTIRLGPLVASPNFRHPVTFAKELVALDDVSGGRVIAGIGAGGTGWDADALGQPRLSAAGRADRFEEFVQAVDLMLRQPAASYSGIHYVADEARTYPGCVQQPRLPLAIAATGPRGMRLAASYGDYWVTTGAGADPGPLPPRGAARAVAVQVRLLEEACEDVGRDPTSIRRLVVTGPVLEPGLDSAESFVDAVGRYAAVGVTDLVVHWPRPAPPYEGDVERFESVVATALGR